MEKLAENKSERVFSNQLPYSAEYAKSNRSGCKGCSGLISQGALRMSIRIPSRFFDGLQDNWYHYHCFWTSLKGKNINEASIRGMDYLKWDDQEKIRRKIPEYLSERVEEKQLTVKADYAKTDRGKCKSCKNAINKKELKLTVKNASYHPNCLSNRIEFHDGADKIEGYQSLKKDDQTSLKSIFGIKKELDKEKIIKVEKVEKKPSAIDKSVEEIKNRLKVQADQMWKIREQFAKCLNKKQMQMLLQANNIRLPEKGGESKLMDILVDCAIFGCPLPCKHCNGGQIVFSSTQQSYKCTGHVTEYTRCTFTDRNPPRAPFKIPDEMKELVKSVKLKKMMNREYNTASNEEVIQPAVSRFPVKRKREEELGLSRSKSAQSGEPRGKRVQTVKNGAVVDEECEVHEYVHVWSDSGGKLWQTTLGKADLVTGQNSYYKLQLLKHDSKEKFYLFRSWGRVGTEIGGSKTERYRKDLAEAKEAFAKLFNEKTGNDWETSENFKKIPGKMGIIEINYGVKSDALPEFAAKAGSLTKLPTQVQQIIQMIFNIEAMNDILRELEIDMDKLPLGKLSQRHLKSAYTVLTELQKLIAAGDANYEHFLDASNRFFTLIPHNYGMKNLPLLSTPKLICEKTKLLDELLEIEVAYRILKSDKEADLTRDPIDVHYEKLNCKLEVLSSDTDEFKLIEEYAKNTHAPTHDAYTIEIIDILKVCRNGEDARFKKNISNRHLLWHGSRLTNYASILSLGLRIAPPEAPVTGYMFGKGIYFADMISKSANYCYAVKEGLLLLCDVALGQIQEETCAKNIVKPKKDKHSVKGVGRTITDPKDTVILKDGLIVPKGKPLDTEREDLTLLYNEYIVYDEAQVQLKYLVRAKFNYSFF